MARIRTIKSEFWTSEQIVETSRDARLLFIGMWNFANDFGVLKNSARTIKSRVFAGDDDITSDTVRHLIDELVRNDLVGIFSGPDDVEYIHVLTWQLHQKIDRPNTKNAILPPTDKAGYITKSSSQRRTIRDLFDAQSPPEGKGREGKGRDIDRSDEIDEGSPNDDGFEEFYDAFPRHVGRGQAERAHRTARKKVSHESIMAGVTRYAAERTDQDAKFTAHPATWLNGERWKDDPTPGANGHANGNGHDLGYDPQWKMRAKAWRDDKFWTASWGPKPGEPGCDCPPELLTPVEF